MIPTAIAPTENLAEPRVERFVKKIAEECDGTLLDFYACVPCLHSIKDFDGNEWIEGTWVAKISTCSFSTYFLSYLQGLSETISIDDVENIHGKDGRLELDFVLTGRVLRW